VSSWVATLVWLGTACSLKTVLQRLAPGPAICSGRGAGGAGGFAYACAMLKPCQWAWQSSPHGWPARQRGAAVSHAGGGWCCARGRTPAATTARLTELQSRIRPHFLFNTLNSAIALVRAEPAKAESLLEDLSDLFRTRWWSKANL
jgi:two-component system sensor histidine kinase AlgZ